MGFIIFFILDFIFSFILEDFSWSSVNRVRLYNTSAVFFWANSLAVALNFAGNRPCHGVRDFAFFFVLCYVCIVSCLFYEERNYFRGYVIDLILDFKNYCAYLYKGNLFLILFYAVFVFRLNNFIVVFILYSSKSIKAYTLSHFSFNYFANGWNFMKPVFCF